MSLINEALKKAAREVDTGEPLENAIPGKIIFISSARGGGHRSPLLLIGLLVLVAGVAVLFQVETARRWVLAPLVGAPSAPKVSVKPPNPAPVKPAPKKTPSVDKAVVARQIQEAIAALHEGDDTLAKSLFEKVIKIAPSSAVAHNGLGLSEKGLGHADLAERHYLEAIRLDTRYAEPHNNLALLYDQRNQTDRAIVEYTTTLSLRPDYPEARLNFAIALERKGRSEDAKREYRQFLAKVPPSMDDVASKVKAHLSSLS